MALLLSAWAPIATGVAVLMSESTTQLADFLRRSVELVALGVSWGVFRHLRRRPQTGAARRARLERGATLSVAVALTVSGLVTLSLAVHRLGSFEPGGDVRLGLGIAALGLAVNGGFWRRYARLVRERPDGVIDAQRRLYRAKLVVDAGVIAALGTVWLAPGRPVTRWVDLGGSAIVALYLLWSARQAARRRAPPTPVTGPVGSADG